MFTRSLLPMRLIPFLALLMPGFLSAQTPDDRGYIVQVGDPMPPFELTATDGTVYTNASVEGQVVVLQFTASWCSVCRQEMPELEAQVHQAFQGQDFLLLGVDLDEPQEKVEAFAAQMGISYPIAPDSAGGVFYSIAGPKSGVTRNVVLDRTGTIRFLTRLYDPEEFEAMIAAIEGLLAE